MSRLTGRGGAFLMVGALGIAVGLAFGSLLAGTAGLALLLLVGEAATRPPRKLPRLARRTRATTVREGGRIEVEIEGDAPRGLRIDDRIPPGLLLVEGTPQARRYVLEGHAPGRWTLGPLSLVQEDDLGLARTTRELPLLERVSVHPTAEEARDVPIASRVSLPLGGVHATGQSGSGSDFYALRAYQDGDTLREVNWRASARSGKGLVVNQREKESQSLVTYFIDTRAVAGVGTQTRNAYVAAARALATLATHHARRRDRTRLVTYGESVRGPVAAQTGDTALTSLLDALFDATPSGDTSLAQAVAATLPTLRPRAPVVILSHFLRDPTAPDAIAALRALDQAVTVIAMDPQPFLRAAGTPEAQLERHAETHARLLDALRAQGARVLPWNASRPLSLALAEAAAA